MMDVAGPGGLNLFGWLKDAADFGKEATKTKQGLFVAVVLMAVVMLTLGLVGLDKSLQPWLLGAVVGLILATLVAAVIVLPKLDRGAALVQQAATETQRETAKAQAEAAAITPSQLAQPPVAAAEIERRSDLLTASDGTFAFALPGQGWEVAERRLASLSAEGLRDFGVSETAVDISLPFQPGPVMTVKERRLHRLSFPPGARANGRLMFGVPDEEFFNTVIMYSTGKRGLAVADLTPEHLLATIASGDVQLGLRIGEITRAALPSGEGVALVLRATRMFEGVNVDGAVSPPVTVNLRMHIVERGYFLFVIRAAWLSGPSLDPRVEGDVDAIINSVTLTTAATGESRARRDAEEADAKWQYALEQHLPGLLRMRASALLDQIRERHGRPPPEVLERAQRLLESATAPEFRPLLPVDLVQSVEEATALIERAAAGDAQAIAALAAKVPEEATA